MRTVRRTIPTPARCSEWDIATPLNPAHQARATVVEVVVYSVTVVEIRYVRVGVPHGFMVMLMTVPLITINVVLNVIVVVTVVVVMGVIVGHAEMRVLMEMARCDRHRHTHEGEGPGE